MSNDNATTLINNLEKEIHVWFCCPDEITDKAVLDQYLSILSVEECEKYKRFHFEKDRHSYLVSHVLVRKVLSLYCTVRPEEWRFTNNEYGKPDISTDIESPAINFNLSHTDGMSAMVVILEADCGVDVENVNRKSKSLAVAERMFAEPELAVMRNSDEQNLKNHFFDYWTLREAYVKGLGTGLGGSSKAFYFTIEDSNNTPVCSNETAFSLENFNFITQDLIEKVAQINFINNIGSGSLDWKFFLLEPSSNHIASIAIKSKNDKKIVNRKVFL